MFFHRGHQFGLYYVSCTVGSLIGGSDILMFAALALFGQVLHDFIRLMGKVKTASFMALLGPFTLVAFLTGAGRLGLFIAVAGRRLGAGLAVLFQNGFEFCYTSFLSLLVLAEALDYRLEHLVFLEELFVGGLLKHG
jgi:hypothetical protein